MAEMVIISMTIVALALIAGMTLNGIAEKVAMARRLRHDAPPAAGAADVSAIAERQQLIEDRLRVLERIATDRGSLLADEIEALRGEALAIGTATPVAGVAAQ